MQSKSLSREASARFHKLLGAFPKELWAMNIGLEVAGRLGPGEGVVEDTRNLGLDRLSARVAMEVALAEPCLVGSLEAEAGTLGEHRLAGDEVWRVPHQILEVGEEVLGLR